ncbi:hypothetical protein OUZ56_016499 [Daphnia magna]|uniref:Uncharacterized protein n=1 Tax=Daphnia magna TaxID=35525 RepID=A0ABR0AQQ4_9CRUS|nr:hypothetical protein OUZ56_016499 [Daphnia magna]
MKQSYDEGLQRTGARLNFSPSVSTVWFGDYYFSKYSGYAKYRELFSLTHARLLWWFESDEDIYHPTPHQTDFYTEITQAEMDNRLAARSTWNDVLTSFDMEPPGPEDFHLLREFSHSLGLSYRSCTAKRTVSCTKIRTPI